MRTLVWASDQQNCYLFARQNNENTGTDNGVDGKNRHCGPHHQKHGIVEGKCMCYENYANTEH